VTERREELAERLRLAWHNDPRNRWPIADRWLLVADAALADEPIPGWEIPTDDEQAARDRHPAGRDLPALRDHAYNLTVTYPDGSTCHDEGAATAAELAGRLRFEATLCSGADERGPSPASALEPDDVTDGVPTWTPPHVAGLPIRLAAFYDGVTIDGTLIQDLRGIEHTAWAMLAAVDRVRTWRA